MHLHLKAVGAGLLAGIVAICTLAYAPIAHAATVPPWENPPDSQVRGNLVFYDALGNIISGGNISDSPIAAYVRTTTVPPAQFDSATQYGARAVNGTPPSGWTSAQMNAGNTYPVAGAPGGLATSPDAVSVGSAGDLTLQTLQTNQPHPPSDTGTAYEGMYQIRLKLSSSTGGGSDTQYYESDIKITGGTWAQIYPAPPTQVATTTHLVVGPPSPQTAGTPVFLTATVTPSTATGTVVFQSDGTPINAGVSVTAGAASTSTSSLIAGSHTLTAAFVPTDTNGFFGSTSSGVPYVINVAGTPLTVTTTALPGSTLGASSYSATLNASGGSAPLTWSESGPLPGGLTLSTAGVISGVPSGAGTFPFTVTVTDSSMPTHKTASANLSITISPAPVITTLSLPTGTVSAAYSGSLSGTGGTGAYTWSVVAGSLPGGLQLNAGTGAISGTPLAANTTNFTIQLADSTAPTPVSVTKAFSITIGPPPAVATILTTTLPDGTVGASYSTAISAAGGSQPYTWSVSLGSLPPGLSLSSSGGIAGTPTAAGSFSFTVRITDVSSPTAEVATRDLTISVNPSPTPLISTASLAGGTVGAAYSASLGVSGGTPPYSWSLSTGALPAGLTLSSAGVISGTPTSAGTSSFTVAVADTAAHSDSKPLSIAISPAAGNPGPSPVVTLSPPALPFWNQTVGVTSKPKTVTLTNGLPSPLIVTQALVSPSLQGGDFTITKDLCSGATIPSGGTCTLAVTFQPQAEGQRAGLLGIADNGPGGSQSIVLIGKGVHMAGYWLSTAAGEVFAYGEAKYFGSAGALKLKMPVVGIASTPDSGGYWQIASDGGMFSLGDAGFFGSMGGKHLNSPIVGMAPSADGLGYWQIASDGGMFAFGDAGFFGSMGGKHLNSPIVGMAQTPDGQGYWLVAADGGMFAFGDAAFVGSMGAQHLNSPIVGMAQTPDGQGYWLVAADGGMFAFGDAAFSGSMGAQHLNSPIVGMSPTPSGLGYWLAAKDGGVFALGDAKFFGSAGATSLSQGLAGIAPAL